MKATVFVFLAVLLRRDLKVTKGMTTATSCLQLFSAARKKKNIQEKKNEHGHKYVHSTR